MARLKLRFFSGYSFTEWVRILGPLIVLILVISIAIVIWGPNNDVSGVIFILSFPVWLIISLLIGPKENSKKNEKNPLE